MKSIQVAVGIIFKEGAVLIARRKPGTKYAGQWEFPGGKIEPGESASSCLQREIEEEFCLTVAVGTSAGVLKYTYPTELVELHIMFADFVSGALQLTVHDTFQWVPPQLLEGYHLLEADLPIAIMLREGRSVL